MENCKDFHFRGLWLWLHLDPDVNTHWIIEKEDTEASKQGHSADQWLQDHPHGASDLQHIIMSNQDIDHPHCASDLQHTTMSNHEI